MAKQVKKACGTTKKKMTKAKDVKKATKAKATKPTQEKQPKSKMVNIKIGNGEPVLSMQYMRNKPKKG